MMSVFMLLFWALVTAGVIYLVRGNRSATGADTADTARRILDDRFARGEIDADEYRTRRDTLTTK